MTSHIPERFSASDWALVISNLDAIPPRDPEDDEEKDDDDEEEDSEDEREPAVIKEPEEDE